VRYRNGRGDREAKAAVFLSAVLVVLAVVAIRLVHLQVVQSEKLKEISDNNRLRTEFIPALRGRILDREGHVLADNRPSFCAVLDPLISEYRVHPERLDITIRALAMVMDLDAARLARKISREKYRAPLGIRVKCGLSDLEVAAIEERAGRLPGVRIEARPQRRYPGDGLACHLLGTVGEVTELEIKQKEDGGYKAGDFAGRRGVEKEYEGRLRGKDGRRQTQVDALGRKVGLFGGLERIPASPGRDLQLALDMGLQSFVEDTLSGYSRGAVVVVDVPSGGVLAMASTPSFDPNSFSRGLTPDEWKSIEMDGRHPLINRCTQATYPPGSTFKVVTAIAALEEGVISPDEKPVNCVGHYVLGVRRFGCWKKTGHGRLDMYEALAQSCSSYFYYLGRLLGVERLTAWAKRLGLPAPTGIDLPVERRNFVPDPEWYDEKYGEDGWTQGLALNLAIGQGELLVTPLKLSMLAMALGGSGRWKSPRVADGPPGEWEEWNLSPRTLEIVRRGMFLTVQGDNGSGRLAAVPGVTVGGKTGTAQNPHGDDHSIFIGFAPWESPRVAIAVYLENAGHGGQRAAPLAGAVLNYCFRRLYADSRTALGAAGLSASVDSPEGGRR
jgi:penicillin-binding protein 2